MALLKKCNLCSEKGLFLKLTNGLCDHCKLNLETLESDYTAILQKIALNPNNKGSVVSDLNILMTKAKIFEGISSSVSIENCKSLLKSLTTTTSDSALPIIDQNININNSLTSSTSNLDNIITPHQSLKLKLSPTTKVKLNLAPNRQDSTSEKHENVVYKLPVQKIRNLIEPLTEIDNDNDCIDISVNKKNKSISTLASTNSILKKTPTTLNLNLQSKLNKKEFKNKIENTLNNTSILNETQSIKDTFIINNFKKKCSSLISKLDSQNATLDSIAHNYFHIKNEILPVLNENSITDIDDMNIKKSLDNAKNTLCIRSKQKENDLFDFFNYITIFVQTTGLSPKNSDIIEISAVKVSYGKIIDEFHTLVNPIKTIKLSVTKTTGISNEDVEDKQTIDMIIPNLIKFIGDYQLVAFNPKPVDLFLNSTLKKLNMDTLKKSITSAVNLYRIRFKNFHGQPPTLSDISSICLDLLSSTDVAYIDSFKSFSLSNSHAIYKIYEILKYRYK
ncbi:MAG: 3'-5' exonuclease [Sarcina sp.]